ncbi:hypothetical protein M3181_14945 [Mesobacillus maritimus]|uniref:hypothetical protein n=1 Tax=Mesobacillus maritimus TaxID=1643336 RepID=UPI002040A432|nr:hypothetical protein [Mesobacillus maritimus]MCM3670278.1 hypothetical protein [Mesobacillus maritimus]
MAKATKGYKREHGLTVEQYNAIDLLITGENDQETADIIGVNRVTVTKWRNYDLHFKAELNKRRKEVWGSSIDRMRSLIPKAIERLEKEIDMENGWKVALEIIKISGIENQHIQGIGHDEVEKIIEEEAEKRSTEKLFSTVSDYSKEEILNEYKGKLETL